MGEVVCSNLFLVRHNVSVSNEDLFQLPLLFRATCPCYRKDLCTPLPVTGVEQHNGLLVGPVPGSKPVLLYSPHFLARLDSVRLGYECLNLCLFENIAPLFRTLSHLSRPHWFHFLV